MYAEASNMAYPKKNRQQELLDILPNAINALKKNILDPFFNNPANRNSNERAPLRSELFTEKQMQVHAHKLAQTHKLVTGARAESLLRRLAENEKILMEVHQLLTDTVKQNEKIVPAGEWLLDNFYLIEEQIYNGKKYLPKGYSKGLPQLIKGESAGLPRVYDIAVEIISHSDGHIDIKSLLNFIISYQNITDLNLGELWAIPIMLRLALIENLRRLSLQIANDLSNKTLADKWAQRMIDTIDNDPKNLVLIIADMARSSPTMESSFVAEFNRKIQERGNALSLALDWMEQYLSEHGLSSSELIHHENQKQAADQVSISNSINSLRFLNATNWREFVEDTSIVETILRNDDVYVDMDFNTRDHYRHVIEKLARKSVLSEKDIATAVIELAGAHGNHGDGKRSHVGYYLVDQGISQTEKYIKVKRTQVEKIGRFFSKAPFLTYVGSSFIITALICWWLILKGIHEKAGLSLLIGLGIVCSIVLGRLSISVINWLVTILSRPQLLPRMDFSKGIPDDCRTMVVVPSIISSIKGINTLVQDLEVRFIANRDSNLHFALLTDFKDAASEDLPDDKVLLQTLHNLIIDLNRKYDRELNDTFFLFHRPRKWNKKEKVWMGEERKRGKLADLNALILENKKENFSEIIGEERIYTSVKYVITLDTDTQLPRESAWKMISTLAHPLNRAVYSEKKRRVIDGYTILQPRVSNSLPSSDSSFFARMHGTEAGIDPYTKAVSDVYQDMFAEGSFIGKGVYDVVMFEKVLKERLPDNRILSHDLLEGCYARSGLITDVQLYESYPEQYITDMQRRHRWIRGDWQIGAWIWPYVKGHDKRLHKNPLSKLSKWKIFDNLRRSLVPVGFFLLLLYGWFFSASPLFWTSVVLLILLIPVFIGAIWELFFKKRADTIFLHHFTFSMHAIVNTLIQQFIEVICLPYEVAVNLDAILRTIWRLRISRRHLLQWNAYHPAQKQKSIAAVFFMMWSAPFLSVVTFIGLVKYAPSSLLAASPLILLWLFSPLVAWSISKKTIYKKIPVSDKQKVHLHILARKIWHFFETFVTENENWLPPDNYQEEPVERIAHRTSPTNIGLYLLSSLTAHDFGYITMRQFTERIGNTINTLLKMERYQGHLYNWYDTVSLVPLPPKYISTVDSGNLVGHLVTLKEGLLSLENKSIINKSIFKGLSDSLGAMMEDAGSGEDVKKLIRQLENEFPSACNSVSDIRNYLLLAEKEFNHIIRSEEKNNALPVWQKRITDQINAIKEYIETSVPWIMLDYTPTKFQDIVLSLPEMPTVKQVAGIEQRMLQQIVNAHSGENTDSERAWLQAFTKAITDAANQAKEFILTVEYLATKCDEFSNIEYDFLFDRSQKLLSIGFNADEHRRDNSYYDLLASEARLTTFMAIAQGKLPQESWFSLGRQLTNLGTTPILLSWSGSMFEYLMPLLVMPTYDNTLLDETNRAVVKKQIEYGKKLGIPWGISESGYNMFDANLNYQYRSFGVPGLGFKRGLSEDIVISPYSTVMALMVSPEEACTNLESLKKNGMESRFGFFEAMDYTPSRMVKRQEQSLVRSYMAHHQGMSLLSIAYLLCDRPMQKLFQCDVNVKSALLLLQEKVPIVSTFYSPSMHVTDITVVPASDNSMRVINTPNTAIPEVQLLSNGRYHLMITNAGGGYSHWKNISINRWREDFTCDNWGTFCYIRDLDTDIFWSAAFQPTLKQTDNYEAVFSQGRAEFRRHDASLETHTEIVISPEDDIELRRVHLTNHSKKVRTLEITSYTEITLVPPAADSAHPAFSNLFVQTEINRKRHAIIATRRPRSANEINPWMFHLMKVKNAAIADISYETDRSRFIGRGNTTQAPDALKEAIGLSGSEGSVLDPSLSIQYRITLQPHETAIIDMIYGIAETNELCNGLIDKYQDNHLTNRVLELAWTHSQVILRQINATESDAQLYARLASHIIFANASMRADPSVIIKNYRKQSGLWSYSISGDIPIVLLQIEDSSNINLVRQLVQAHSYWRSKGLFVDLVIWNEDHGGYRQVLHNDILSLASPALSPEVKDQPGGIFIRASEQITNEDRVLFEAVAHIVISDKSGTLEEQINRKVKTKPVIPYFNPTKFYASVPTSMPVPNDLKFFNGYGGFSNDGHEYIIITEPSKPTPAPWVNVLANSSFGCVISESGQSYSWAENAHEFRLTPWNNDPVTDLKGEAFYLRDEESGKLWSPSPLPCTSQSTYITRHGFGYSIFEHTEDAIRSEMTVFVDIEMPVKYIVLKLKNQSQRKRFICAAGYVEWVLGDLRSKSQMHIVTDMDKDSGAVIAKNTYSTEFEKKVAFFLSNKPIKYFTTDRTEFIGRNGTASSPDGMSRARLSGKTGAALDACAALQVIVELEADEETEIVFMLGAGNSPEETTALIAELKNADAAQALTNVHAYWQDALSAVTIATPDDSVNILVNGWLNYQTLACRVWARSGFYQSGGAFGFRDQLQDVLSLIHSKPALVRDQILLCASRQFKKGDVQHWWHPPGGRGVRTTCSDDYLWLPYVTSRYVFTTGDVKILNEQVHFLEGRPLNAGEESYYDLPIRSDTAASLYDHCVKAIENGLNFGENGLPLIGSGDWNDGMDKVGEHGKGESVWLAFFLYDILQKFEKIANIFQDKSFAQKCNETAATLKNSIDTNAWDGQWYKRAFFDDGTPLGSVKNDECKIDSIAQSWAVISKAGEQSKTMQAMESAYKYLVRHNEKLIQLFNPPFDKSALNPGYIKGYVPGVRENGGQYTHAAIWLIMAFAELGDSRRVWELLKIVNPVLHASDPSKIATYKIEPYVIAADVYMEEMHKGRGGWTWYTGSAGWMYQFLIESFIGIKKEGDFLKITPCIPPEWDSVKIKYRYESNVYDIEIRTEQRNDEALYKIIINGIEQKEGIVKLQTELLKELPEKISSGSFAQNAFHRNPEQ